MRERRMAMTDSRYRKRDVFRLCLTGSKFLQQVINGSFFEFLDIGHVSILLGPPQVSAACLNLEQTKGDSGLMPMIFFAEQQVRPGAEVRK